MDYEHGESASLFIGKVARRAGIGVETIRFYERQELLAARARKESGYRLYSEGVLGKIQFIRRTKELGFSLREIKELLLNVTRRCRQSGGVTTCEVMQ
jgi:DNA-binding transcriptional MerR regulator